MLGRLVTISCFISGACSVAFGQDELDIAFAQGGWIASENVAVATGNHQTVKTAPAVVSVITARDIDAIGARDLYDVLRTVPGFFLPQTTSGLQPFAVRGFSSANNQNLLVLLDGVPQINRVSGDRFAALGLVPLNIIDRIEIMRGPGSALYGADAYSGVINIITRQSLPGAAEFSAGAGSQNSRHARLLGGGHTGLFDVVGAIEYQESDGNRPLIDADLQTSLDALFGTRASLAPGRANTEHRLFGALLNATGRNMNLMLRTASVRNAGLGIGLAAALDPFGNVDSDTFEGRFSWQTQGDGWAANWVFDQFFYRVSLNDAHYFPAGAFEAFPEGVVASNETQQNNVRFQSKFDYTGLADHHISAGIGAESGRTRQNSEARNFVAVDGWLYPLGGVRDITDPSLLSFGAREFTHDLQFVYAQDEWAFHPNWKLTWGARYDHYADYGDQIDPRAALVWNASSALAIKLMYGRGFRGPSLIDTNARQSPSVAGNPALKPERIESFELAFDYTLPPSLKARLNLFSQKTDDQIRLLTGGNALLTPANVARQVGRGGELEMWWDIDPATTLYGAYSYQDNRDSTTDSDLGYGPHHLLYARLERRQRPWFFSVQARHVGRRDRGFQDPRARTDPYTLLDGLVRYRLGPHVEAALEVRNLFDSNAVDDSYGTALPSDFPGPGRTFYFTISGHF